MKGDELLFELRAPGGEVYRLYLDGRAEGFLAGFFGLLKRAGRAQNRRGSVVS